jgi:hypothetical protein
VYLAATGVPIVYSHHDWQWRIKRHRAGNVRRLSRPGARFWLMKRSERAIVRAMAGCVSASVTEADEIHALGVEWVAFLPPTYYPLDAPPEGIPPDPPRLVHLGGMNTTANRLGLQRFMELAWPVILEGTKRPPELWVVGSMKGASEALLAQLGDADAVLTGYVGDLGSALRPYDIHIVPWEYNTGTRTRIPLILNYGQVLVSTKAAAQCLPELKHGEGAILVDDLPSMAEEILPLLHDAPRRKHIALDGYQLFLHHYTRQAVQPRFDAFLARLCQTPTATR